jgi:hypothetical protein
VLDHHRIDLGIDALGACDRFVQQLDWAYFLFADELGKTERVVAGIFLEGHRLFRSTRWQTGRDRYGRDRGPRGSEHVLIDYET